jgi:hypothetical protein
LKKMGFRAVYRRLQILPSKSVFTVTLHYN